MRGWDCGLPAPNNTLSESIKGMAACTHTQRCIHVLFPGELPTMSPVFQKQYALPRFLCREQANVSSHNLSTSSLCPNGQLTAAQATTHPCVIDLFIDLDRKTKPL